MAGRQIGTALGVGCARCVARLRRSGTSKLGCSRSDRGRSGRAPVRGVVTPSCSAHGCNLLAPGQPPRVAPAPWVRGGCCLATEPVREVGRCDRTPRWLAASRATPRRRLASRVTPPRGGTHGRSPRASCGAAGMDALGRAMARRGAAPHPVGARRGAGAGEHSMGRRVRGTAAVCAAGACTGTKARSAAHTTLPLPLGTLHATSRRAQLRPLGPVQYRGGGGGARSAERQKAAQRIAHEPARPGPVETSAAQNNLPNLGAGAQIGLKQSTSPAPRPPRPPLSTLLRPHGR